MRVLRSDALFVVLAGLATMSPAAAQKLDCGLVSAESRAAISDSLDQAQLLVDQGAHFDATELIAIAGGPIQIQFGAGNQYIDFECAGKNLRSRFFRVRRQVYRPLGKAAEDAALLNPGRPYNAASNYLIGRNLDDVKRVLNAPQDPKLVSQAGPALRKLIDRMNYSVESGYGLIAEEAEALTVYTDQLNRLITRSKEKAVALLKQENDTVTGPMTDMDAAAADMAMATDAIAGGFLGIDNVIPGDRESRPIMLRAQRSETMLRLGRNWVDWIDPDASVALKSRAVVRGDALLPRADDSSNGLSVRDGYYSAVIAYFDVAGARQKSDRAAASQLTIQPALKAERAGLEQQMAQKAEELKESADAFKRSMEKTSEEQESFKSEADSLEDELDF